MVSSPLSSIILLPLHTSTINMTTLAKEKDIVLLTFYYFASFLFSGSFFLPQCQVPRSSWIWPR